MSFPAPPVKGRREGNPSAACPRGEINLLPSRNTQTNCHPGRAPHLRRDDPGPTCKSASGGEVYPAPDRGPGLRVCAASAKSTRRRHASPGRGCRKRSSVFRWGDGAPAVPYFNTTTQHFFRVLVSKRPRIHDRFIGQPAPVITLTIPLNMGRKTPYYPCLGRISAYIYDW